MKEQFIKSTIKNRKVLCKVLEALGENNEGSREVLESRLRSYSYKELKCALNSLQLN